MSKPRRNRDARPVKGEAFTTEERMAICNALAKLYRRNIFHLVEPSYPRPPMADVWRTFIPQERWDHMATAQDFMVMPRNAYQYFAFEDEVEVGLLCKMEITTKRLLPCRQGLPDPVIPDVYTNFADAASQTLSKWIQVYNTLVDLNTSATRLTAAYHWPCASALLTMGGKPRPDLDAVKRPGNINDGQLAVRLRDTSAFVMQHMLLPPIDAASAFDYEGDEETGLAARLVFNAIYGVFGNSLWPLRD